MKNIPMQIASVLFSLALFAAPAGFAQAEFLSTETAFASATPAYEKAELIAVLRSQDVQERLAAMGVDAEQAEARVAAMTAEEIRQLSAHLDDLPAGGSVVGVVLTLFIVFIITDAICATDIFPFVNCIN